MTADGITKTLSPWPNKQLVQYIVNLQGCCCRHSQSKKWPHRLPLKGALIYGTVRAYVEKKRGPAFDAEGLSFLATLKTSSRRQKRTSQYSRSTSESKSEQYLNQPESNSPLMWTSSFLLQMPFSSSWNFMTMPGLSPIKTLSLFGARTLLHLVINSNVVSFSISK